jgi:hypothetical protein
VTRRDSKGEPGADELERRACRTSQSILRLQSSRYFPVSAFAAYPPLTPASLEVRPDHPWFSVRGGYAAAYLVNIRFGDRPVKDGWSGPLRQGWPIGVRVNG